MTRLPEGLGGQGWRRRAPGLEQEKLWRKNMKEPGGRMEKGPGQGRVHGGVWTRSSAANHL